MNIYSESYITKLKNIFKLPILEWYFNNRFVKVFLSNHGTYSNGYASLENNIKENYFHWSNDLTNKQWGEFNNIIVTENNSPAIDGSYTATTLDDQNNTAQSSIENIKEISNLDAIFTITARVKKGTSTESHLFAYTLGGTTKSFNTRIDWTATPPTFASFPLGNVSMFDKGDGWYEFQREISINVDNTIVSFYIVPAGALASSTGTVHIDGISLREGLIDEFAEFIKTEEDHYTSTIFSLEKLKEEEGVTIQSNILMADELPLDSNVTIELDIRPEFLDNITAVNHPLIKLYLEYINKLNERTVNIISPFDISEYFYRSTSMIDGDVIFEDDYIKIDWDNVALFFINITTKVENSFYADFDDYTNIKTKLGPYDSVLMLNQSMSRYPPNPSELECHKFVIWADTIQYQFDIFNINDTLVMSRVVKIEQN